MKPKKKFIEHHFLLTPVEAIRRLVRNVYTGTLRYVTALYRMSLRLARNRSLQVYARDVAALVAAEFVLAIVVYCLVFSYVERKIPPAEEVDEVVYLDQGWGGAVESHDREAYYYTPQGAFLKQVRYDWFVHLERPWKTTPFASPSYMRSYGFIVDPVGTRMNPDQLPVGFAKRYDPSRGETFLDISCAACHTGELHFVKDGHRAGVRIDGGQALQNITSTNTGTLGNDLLLSLVSTYINPLKFRRFAHAVLGSEYSFKGKELLRVNLYTVIKGIAGQAWVDFCGGFYPVEEGYGRTDAIARISNNVFATNLDAVNYAKGTAPVSFPAVWNIWKYDWVQYTGSVSQPMARNIGETLGTGAQYYLLDPYGRKTLQEQRYYSSSDILGLSRIEHDLRTLKPPPWPEKVFGPIDASLADEGARYFAKFCIGCHGPHPETIAETRRDAPLKVGCDGNAMPHWKMKMIPVDDIGTDPAAAMNFFRNRVDLRKTGLRTEQVREQIRPIYEQYYRRQIDYYNEELNLLDGIKPKGNCGDPLQRLQTPLLTSASPGARARDQSNPGWDSLSVESAKAAMNDSNAPPKAKENAKEFLKSSYRASLDGLLEQGEKDYVGEKLNGLDLSSVSIGQGLNYIVTMIRNRAYRNLGIEPELQKTLGSNMVTLVRNQAYGNLGSELQKSYGSKKLDEHASMSLAEKTGLLESVRDLQRAFELDGFGELDMPQVVASYKSHPLAGIWATAPYLHNGSVPSLYEMLLPANQRTRKFYIRSRLFDPKKVGLVTERELPGSFLYDTTIPGNLNIGHEFRAGYVPYKEGAPPQQGVIGPELTEHQRWAIIEYLKKLTDEPAAGATAAAKWSAGQ